jgi:hypothetical protein
MFKCQRYPVSLVLKVYNRLTRRGSVFLFCFFSDILLFPNVRIGNAADPIHIQRRFGEFHMSPILEKIETDFSVSAEARSNEKKGIFSPGPGNHFLPLSRHISA